MHARYESNTSWKRNNQSFTMKNPIALWKTKHKVPHVFWWSWRAWYESHICWTICLTSCMLICCMRAQLAWALFVFFCNTYSLHWKSPYAAKNKQCAMFSNHQPNHLHAGVPPQKSYGNRSERVGAFVSLTVSSIKLKTNLTVIYCTGNKMPPTVDCLIASAWLRTAFMIVWKVMANTFYTIRVQTCSSMLWFIKCSAEFSKTRTLSKGSPVALGGINT